MPHVARVRHEARIRRLTVDRVEDVAPQMRRVVLSGAELQGFTSLGFDDHVKLLFPCTDQNDPAGTVVGSLRYDLRDFTPRRFDARAGELWIDFFLHDAGPAAMWATQVEAGQTLEVGGPRGSAVISLDGIDTHVLVGDETAVPAIGRRLEELPTGARALVVVETDGSTGWPSFLSSVDMDVVWVSRERQSGAPAQELIHALRGLEFPARSFVWVATESNSARAIRRHLREERGLDKAWIKAAGYWQRGAAGAHQTIAEDE
ncbi:MAG: siderophore-interacting protein [Steroidobacteraceae bacterium]